MAARSLLRTSSAYALGDGLERLIGLAMLPVYAYALSPTQFGLLALVQVLTGLGSSLLGLGIFSAITRLYFNPPQNATSARVVGGSWLVLLAVPLVVLTFVALIGQPVFAVLAASLDFSSFVLPALAITYLNVAFVEPELALARTLSEPARYAGVTLTRAGLTAAASTYVLLVRETGAAGVVMAQLLATLFVSLLCARRLWQCSPPIADASLIGQVLRFGLPLIPQSTAVWALRLQDRLFLDWLAGPAAVGLYAMAARIASPVQVVLDALQRTMLTSFSEASANSRLVGDLRRRVVQFVAVGVSGTAAAVLVAPPLVPLVLPAAYGAAGDVLGLLLASLLCASLVRLANSASIFYEGRAGWATVIMVLAVPVNASLNLLWIPALGVQGAAAAALTTNCLLVVVAYWRSPLRSLMRRRLLPLIAYVAGTSAVVAGLSVQSFVGKQLSVSLGLVVVGALAFALVALNNRPAAGEPV